MKKSLQLMEHLLGGNALSHAQFETARGMNEDLHLEFKSGELYAPSKRNDGARIVREYVTAFANADGGVLFVGVADKRGNSGIRDIECCEANDNSSPADWAARALIPVAPSFAIMPKIQELVVDRGRVLVIAVARQPRLIPVVESGRAVYYVRIHDSTLQAPDYLLSDLLLGRRQHPILDVRIREFSIKYPGKMETMEGEPIKVIMPWFAVENQGLSIARGVVAGMVTWTWNGSHPTPTPSLRTHVEVREPDNEWARLCKLSHIRFTCGSNPDGSVRPFEEGQFHSDAFEWPQPFTGAQHRAAFYVMAEGSSPDWYELRVRIPQMVPSVLRHTELREGFYERSLDRVFTPPIVSFSVNPRP